MKRRHGEDYDWMNTLVDGAVVHAAGGGKAYGW
jgi:hypothetical protein